MPRTPPIAFRSAQSSSNAAGGTSIVMATPGHLSISLRGTPTAGNNAGGGTTLTVAFPTGLVANDVLVLSVTVVGGSGITITPPTTNGTWALLSRVNSTTNLAQGLYWKVAAAGDVTDGQVVVTITSAKASGTVAALANASSTEPTAAYIRGQNNASSLTITVPASGTITAGNGIDICMTGMERGGNGIGTNASYTHHANSESTGGSAATRSASHVSSRVLTPSGTSIASFTEVWTGTAAVNIGQAVYIQEATQAAVAVDGDVMVMGITDSGTATIEPPGMVWTERAHWGLNNNQTGIAYGNGHWVTVGQTHVISTSTDGTTWIQNTSADAVVIMNSVGYDAIHDLWVAGGWHGELWTATDPTGTWTKQTSPLPADSTSVPSVVYGNGVWVAVANGGASNGGLATSTDGTAWTLSSSRPAHSTRNYVPNSLAYANGYWVLLDEWVIYTTTDPTSTWTTSVADITAWSGWSSETDSYGPTWDGAKWMVLGEFGHVATANDPTGTWNTAAAVITLPDTTAQFYALGYYGGFWVAVGWRPTTAKAIVAWSDNGGVNWLVTSSTSADQTKAIASNKNDKWVWVGYNGSVNSAPTPPTDYWHPVSTIRSATSIIQSIFWKIAASEPNSYTVVLAPTNTASGVVIVLSGADSTRPVPAGYGGQANASSATITAPALGTFAIADGIDVGIFGVLGATTITPPGSYTEPASADVAATGGPTTEGAYLALSTVATVSSIAATAAAAGINVGHHVFIAEPRGKKPVKPPKPGSGGVDAGGGNVSMVSQAVNRAATY